CGPNQDCENGKCTCPDNKKNCSGTCTDTQTDNKNCGFCGHPCDSKENCVDGKCCPKSGPEGGRNKTNETSGPVEKGGRNKTNETSGPVEKGGRNKSNETSGPVEKDGKNKINETTGP
ncbi:16339_t:CDS:2, partial [Dentiscutata heterogama]